MAQTESRRQPPENQRPDSLILFRRLPKLPEEAGGMLHAIESSCGISIGDLKYRLAGPGFGVLLPKKQGASLEDCIEEISGLGVRAAAVSRQELLASKLPPRAKSLTGAQENHQLSGGLQSMQVT